MKRERESVKGMCRIEGLGGGEDVLTGLQVVFVRLKGPRIGVIEVTRRKGGFMALLGFFSPRRNVAVEGYSRNNLYGSQLPWSRAQRRIAEVQDARGCCTVTMAITGSALDLDGSGAVCLRRLRNDVSSGMKRKRAEIEARCRVSDLPRLIWAWLVGWGEWLV